MFTIQLIIINFATPAIVFIIMFVYALQFSGSPLRSEIYSQKLKVLHIAVFIWSLARILRALCGMYESKLFYGMILGLSDKAHNNFFVPMTLIIVFLVIEIGPFLLVLDWGFMENFVLEPVNPSLTEPLYESRQHSQYSTAYRFSTAASATNAGAFNPPVSSIQHSKGDENNLYTRSGGGGFGLPSSEDWNVLRSDSIRGGAGGGGGCINESHRASNRTSMASVIREQQFIKSTNDFSLVEPFKQAEKGTTREPLGSLYKAKFTDEEKNGGEK